MAEDKEIKGIRKFIDEMGYEIDHEMTKKFKDAMSEERINIRIPGSLKNEIKAIAKKKNIPYQRYIKSVLIDAVTKEKVS